jgi:hypothetical protein
MTIQGEAAMRWYITAAAIAFLGGSVASSVLAQEQGQWVAKPVQCGTLDEVATITKSKGLSLTFAGNGSSNSVNFDEPIQVYVFLGINPDTNEWAITEIDAQGDRGCVIGYGMNFTIDAGTMQKLAGPKS